MGSHPCLAKKGLILVIAEGVHLIKYSVIGVIVAQLP